jgi:hypothetical protein
MCLESRLGCLGESWKEVEAEEAGVSGFDAVDGLLPIFWRGLVGAVDVGEDRANPCTGTGTTLGRLPATTTFKRRADCVVGLEIVDAERSND